MNVVNSSCFKLFHYKILAVRILCKVTVLLKGKVVCSTGDIEYKK